MLPDSHTSLSDMDHEGLIRVSGADAIAFLQGQLSTDIERLTPDLSQFSSWSNAKGRVVTLMRLIRRGDDIYLSLPAGLLAPVLKKLSLYVLRSKVTLSDASSAFAPLGLMGAEAPELLKKAGIAVPAREDQVAESDSVQVVRLHGHLPRYALYGEPGAIDAALQKLGSAGANLVGDESWALEKIRASEPTVYPETSEYFVAQMLGLEELGALDFKKGCYLGQEVIARAHYRGGVKRHLVRAESDSTVPLKPGTDIHAVGEDSPVAEVVDARMDGQGLWQMLLVMQDDARDADLVHGASGAAVMLIPGRN